VTKPGAIAEAHYNIAVVLAEKEPSAAVPHFQEARTLYPEQYATLVDLRLVQCFFKMKDADNLKKALEVLERSNQSSYNALPPAILRWCGWSCFQKHDYLAANKYLSDALVREPREAYMTADGTQSERPKVEPIVWKTLARARLELRLYARGLEAAEHYVSMEKQPYRQAEGMRDQALLLIGLNRGAEARKLCETAIAMGIDGPIKSTLFIALGDAYYIDREYSEAAKYYGRTANVVSDKELKPLALYKITCALKRCGKEGEASQYEQALRTEFPDWVPNGNVQHLMDSPDSAPKS
jgi:Tfp pilus assembly protein PilF